MSLRMGIASSVLAAGLAMASSAWAQAKQDFVLVNQTGYTLSELYVSPSKSDDWQDDVLGQDVLANGESSEITFHRAAKSCKWDLMVVYEDDDSEAVWTDIDLCSVSEITIRYNRKTDTTTATFK